jgi:predicted transcriptional regulator
VKSSNYQSSKLMKCTNLSRNALQQILEPLISEGLLREAEGFRDEEDGPYYQVTEKGERFLEYLGLALSLIDLENSRVIHAN